MTRFLRGWVLILIVVISASPAPVRAQADFGSRYAALGKGGGSESVRLARLFQTRWEESMADNPEFATEAGYPGQNARWSDLSPEALARRKASPRVPLQVLEGINRARLTPGEQVNFDLFKLDLTQALAGARFPEELAPINQMGGVPQEVAQILEMMPAARRADFDDMLARLRAVPRLIEQTMALMRRGLREGVTPPRITLRDVPDQVRSQMTNDRAKSPLMQSFETFPADIPESERKALRNEAWKIIQSEIIPAFAKLHEFLVGDYIPHSRESIGASALPNGAEWYAYLVQRSTTTTLTPKEIHAIGLSEVKRIRGEMEAVIRKVGYSGDFAAFCQFLRTDRQFFYTDAESLLRGYRDISKRVDPELVKLFGRLPQLTYGVVPVPSYAEKSQTTAYYQPGSLRAGRPGNFFANTYALETRPKWEMEALTLHEAVPGHHLQIGIAQELEGQPEFRKYGGYTAFIEGWGLYAESLGEEMGFYRDPYSKFGQLTYEMWRAVRLVVDTGMHSMGWSRQQAIDYFKSNSSKSEHDITVEIDRYIVWPGQALAYKLGELKLKELRAHARKELGDGFDVRAFHDQVLGSGALPLGVLDARIRDWVSAQKSRPDSAIRRLPAEAGK